MSIFSDAASGAGTGAAVGGGVPGAIIGGVLGLGAGLFGHSAEKRKEMAQAQIKASEIQASPWTHMAPQQQIQFAAPAAGAALGGIGAGLGLAQNLSKAQTTSPWANMNQQGQALQSMGSFGQVDPNGNNGAMIDYENQNMPSLYKQGA